MALKFRTASILIVLSALLGGLLAACGMGLGAPATTQPATAQPATAQPATAQPATAQPATATPAPVVTTAPTVPPGVGFMPDATLAPAAGGPGTVVTVTGRRFGSDPVEIRIAMANVKSEALATARPDATGNFQVTFTMPDRLAGQPIPAGKIMVLAEVAQAQLSIGTEFTFTPPAGPVIPAGPSEAVTLLLAQAVNDFYLQGALPYLEPSLRAQVQAGALNASTLLLIQGRVTSYVIETSYADGQGNSYVEASILTDGATTGGVRRIFTLRQLEGVWKVVGVSDGGVIPPPPPAWPGPGWTLVADADLTGDGATDSVYCAPASVTPAVSFGDPQLDAASVVCIEVMISTPKDAFEHTILLRATQKDLIAADRIIGPFASPEKPDGAAAHRLAITPGAKVPVHILPLNGDGSAYGQGVGVYWNAAEGAFRFAGPDVWGTP